MKRLFLAGLILAMATTPAFAHGRPHGISGWADFGSWGWVWDWSPPFSAATLNGTYVFEASGFADDGKPGQVSVLGTLNFDGTSTVTGSLILTRGDTAQYSCSDTLAGSTSGTYSFTSSNPNVAPGSYTMQIPLSGTGNSGTINFGVLVPKPDGSSARVIETDTGALTLGICGTPTIVSLVLKGTLQQLNPEF
jgi:hypothetical protein